MASGFYAEAIFLPARCKSLHKPISPFLGKALIYNNKIHYIEADPAYSKALHLPFM